MEKLHLYFDSKDSYNSLLLLSALKEKGYEAMAGVDDPKESDFVLLLLSKATTLDGLYASNPWLKEEFGYAKRKGFRMMPVLVYRSSYGLEKTWEEGVGDIYDEVISGEFKPFGFDLDDLDPLKEFERIYEEYSE